MIATVTFNPAVDQTVRFDEPMRPGVIMRAGEARFDAGGKGINVSQLLDAMDVGTVATGLLGGFTGEFVREELAAAGVETDFVTVEGTTRLNSTVLAAGEEYKLNQDGPAVGTGVVDRVIDRLRGHDPATVLVGGSLPPGLDAAAIDRVAGGRWETVVDVGGDLLGALDGEYALCKPNREELGTATGRDVSTPEECASAAAAFRERGFERVVASLGADGALLAGPDGVVYAEALPVEVVDTVGAGDALLSGVLAALSDGAGDARALATGVAVAARVVSRAGTGAPDFDGLPGEREQVTVRRIEA